MKRFLIIVSIIFGLSSCVTEKTATQLGNGGINTTIPGIGSEIASTEYIYSQADVEKLKNKYKDLGTIKYLNINSNEDIVINIPKLKVIEKLDIYKAEKLTINNVVSINKLFNNSSYSSTDIDLPDLINIEDINLYIKKTPNFSFPKVKKVSNIYIDGSYDDIVKDVNLDNIEEVTGKLVIDGKSINISLKNLISGNLKFDYIKSLTGLSKATDLSGLEITNTALSEINNSILKSVKGDLKIASNSELKFIKLNNLENITGSFNIYSNYNLLSSSFENLKTIGKDSEDKGISLKSNNNMTYLDMSKLESVQGNFDVEGNYSLFELSFPSLRTINKGLYLNETLNIKRFSFPILENIENNLEISENYRMEAINFNKLKKIGNSLVYKSNTDNMELAFPELEIIGDGVDILSNSYLKGFQLNKLKTTKYIKIMENTNLDNVSLKGLTSVDNIMTISKNKNSITIYLNSGLVVEQEKTIEGTIIKN